MMTATRVHEHAPRWLPASVLGHHLSACRPMDVSAVAVCKLGCWSVLCAHLIVHVQCKPIHGLP